MIEYDEKCSEHTYSGIKRKNIEGIELLDCDGDEIQETVESEMLEDSEALEHKGDELEGNA